MFITKHKWKAKHLSQITKKLTPNEHHCIFQNQNYHHNNFDNNIWLGSTFRNPKMTAPITSVSIWNYTVLCDVDPDSYLFDKIHPGMDEKQLQIIGTM